MAYKHLSSADRDEIWRLHASGLNPNEIRLHTGRAYWTIATVIKAGGGIRPHVRTRSPLRLSPKEREEISRGISARETFVQIAARINRSHSTVSREVARNGGRSRYRACRADQAALERARRPKESKLASSARLRNEVITKLRLRWSPQQISAWLERTYPDDVSMRVSHESIYLALFTRNTQMSGDLHKFLRTRRVRRQPRKRGRRDRRGKNPNMILITDRPPEIEDRANPGHWEGDLVMGSGHRRAIGTLVERTSRYLILLDLIDGYSAEGVNEALAVELAGVPSALRRTLTWDQGTELSSHEAFTEATGIPVYFCHPRSPWERGTNENTNGLLRGYFPKGADLAGTTRSDLDRAAYELNTRPRRTLNWLTPAERFAQLCALTP